MSKRNVHVMALDFGNGFVKGKINDEYFVIPSRIGSKTSEDNQLNGFVEGKLDVSEFIINNNEDEILLFGKDLDKVTNNGKDTASTNNRYNYKAFKDLVECSIGLLAREIPDDVIDVVIASGMPSNEIGTDKEQTFYKTLNKNRLITIDGISKTINVLGVKLIAQPMGTLLDMHMENGKVYKSFTEGKYSVLDFGSGTTIIDTYQNMKRVDEESFVINKGMIDFYKKIASHVSKKAEGSPVTPRQIEKGLELKTCEISKRMSIDFSEDFEKEQENVIESVMSSFETVIGNINTIDRVVVTGGGANVHFKALSKYYPNIFEMAEDSQLSNVRGYEKLGELLKKKVENED